MDIEVLDKTVCSLAGPGATSADVFRKRLHRHRLPDLPRWLNKRRLWRSDDIDRCLSEVEGSVLRHLKAGLVAQ